MNPNQRTIICIIICVISFSFCTYVKFIKEHEMRSYPDTNSVVSEMTLNEHISFLRKLNQVRDVAGVLPDKNLKRTKIRLMVINILSITGMLFFVLLPLAVLFKFKKKKDSQQQQSSGLISPESSSYVKIKSHKTS